MENSDAEVDKALKMLEVARQMRLAVKSDLETTVLRPASIEAASLVAPYVKMADKTTRKEVLEEEIRLVPSSVWVRVGEYLVESTLGDSSANSLYRSSFGVLSKELESNGFTSPDKVATTLLDAADLAIKSMPENGMMKHAKFLSTHRGELKMYRELD